MSVENTSRGWSASRKLLANLRTLRRARRQGGCLVGCEHERTDDGRLPWTTDDYGGWGGHAYHGTEPGVERTPVVFVHGNQRDACDWTAHATYFRQRGYRGDELWAVTFGEPSPAHPTMAAQLDAFVREVRAETGAETVSLVTHSLSVTGARVWLDRFDRYEWVDTFVGLAGPNHGTVLSSWCAKAGLTGGTYKVSPFLRADYEKRDDHPLARLNADETPGDVDYYTLRGTEDSLFWNCPESPALEGATNVAIETDHDGVRTEREGLEHVFEWVAGHDPDDLSYHVSLAR